MDELEAIKEECARRGITRICHFTQSRNLSHILCEAEGLVSRALLTELRPDILNPNDPNRWDGLVEYVNCSIQYPNPWLFRRFQGQEQLFEDWVILVLDPRFLWEPTTLFCASNAATRGVQAMSGKTSFETLFVDIVPGGQGRLNHRPISMLPACPTDLQAEVLISTSVSAQDIHAVIVHDEFQAKKEETRLSLMGIPRRFDWIISPTLFRSEWVSEVRQGRRPHECTGLKS